jgi:hypothetical protein
MGAALDALFRGGSAVAAEFSCSRIENFNSLKVLGALYFKGMITWSGHH